MGIRSALAHTYYKNALKNYIHDIFIDFIQSLKFVKNNVTYHFLQKHIQFQVTN